MPPGVGGIVHLANTDIDQPIASPKFIRWMLYLGSVFTRYIMF